MIINIDIDSQNPIYEQLKSQIILGIFDGGLEEGTQLPSVRQLAADLSINMHTVSKSYKILENEGFLSINKKKGAFIHLDETRLKANYQVADLEEEIRLKLLIYKKIGGDVNTLWKKLD